jgi:periplasmic divalent cation tolerance protein
MAPVQDATQILFALRLRMIRGRFCGGRLRVAADAGNLLTGRFLMNVLQIITTTGTSDDARRIAAALVERRLAACVQIVGPIESVYRWQGKLETAQEWQCWIKTRGDLYASVEQVIRELHPYELPEILTMPAEASKPYLDWLKRETA